MECNSVIKFVTKSKEESKLLADFFEPFKGDASSWTDANNRIQVADSIISKLASNLNASDIYKHLVALDTGISTIGLEECSVSITIDPMNFPEPFCKLLFPFLSENNATGISCYSDSEYGEQTLEYKDGKIQNSTNYFEE